MFGHETETAELQALLTELEVLPREGLFNGVRRTFDEVWKKRYVSRTEIVATCEGLQHTQSETKAKLTREGEKAFNDFMDVLKENGFKSLEKKRYVTRLVVKWRMLEPKLRAYLDDMRHAPKECVVSNGLMREVMGQMDTYARKRSEQFSLAGGR